MRYALDDMWIQLLFPHRSGWTEEIEDSLLGEATGETVHPCSLMENTFRRGLEDTVRVLAMFVHQSYVVRRVPGGSWGESSSAERR